MTKQIFINLAVKNKANPHENIRKDGSPEEVIKKATKKKRNKK